MGKSKRRKRSLSPVLMIFAAGGIVGSIFGAMAFPRVEVKTEYVTEYIREYRYIYTEEEQPEIKYTSLGMFDITAYCACVKCCGKSDGITATGTRATEGRTIAADPKVLPYGTKVIINGHEYVVEDCGGAIKGNKIDIYFDSHEDALQFGVQRLEVFVSE